MQDFFHDKTIKDLAKNNRAVEDVQKMMKLLFKDTIQQVFEAELDDELGYQNIVPRAITLGIAEMGIARKW